MRHFIIIGGGLAGVFASYRLIEAGQQVTMVDDPVPHSASRVAAGLFNVITGRYGSKSWMADTLLPFLTDFMHQPAQLSLLPFFHQLPIYRPFRDIKNYNRWSGRSSNPVYKHLVEFQEKPLHDEQLYNPLGGVLIQGCGWADTTPLLAAMLVLLQKSENFTYIPACIDAKHINLSEKTILAPQGEVAFDDLLLCVGHHSLTHPLWPGIPIIPNKGELLLIEAKELELDFIFSRKVFIIPFGQNKFIVGSTYDNEFTDPYPSEGALAEICAFLDEGIKVPYTVLDQKAGIRPTTPDRRPILGTHPQHDYVHTFTGLGTKGVLLAPYFSQVLVDHLVHNKKLPLEVDIKRFENES